MTEQDVLTGAVQLPTWDELTTDLEPLARQLARIHQPDDSGDCVGCDFTGWEGEPPTWPCRTAEAVLREFDIVYDDTVGFWRTIVRVDRLDQGREHHAPGVLITGAQRQEFHAAHHPRGR